MGTEQARVDADARHDFLRFADGRSKSLAPLWPASLPCSRFVMA